MRCFGLALALPLVTALACRASPFELGSRSGHTIVVPRSDQGRGMDAVELRGERIRLLSPDGQRGMVDCELGNGELLRLDEKKKPP